MPPFIVTAPCGTKAHSQTAFDQEAPMRILTVTTAIVVALLTFPAHAQQDNKGPPTARTDAQKQEDADIDKAYRNATRRERGPAPKVDPWAVVRPADSDKKPKN
jgi:hypothetical protein